LTQLQAVVVFSDTGDWSGAIGAGAAALKSRAKTESDRRPRIRLPRQGGRSRQRFRKKVLAFATESALGACANATTFKTTPSAIIELRAQMHLVGDGQDKFCRMERQSPFLREACYTRAALQERLLAALRPQIVDLEAMPVLVGQSAGYEAACRPGD
jgi:hypothetical protein